MSKLDELIEFLESDSGIEEIISDNSAQIVGVDDFAIVDSENKVVMMLDDYNREFTEKMIDNFINVIESFKNE